MKPAKRSAGDCEMCHDRWGNNWLERLDASDKVLIEPDSDGIRHLTEGDSAAQRSMNTCLWGQSIRTASTWESSV